MANMVTRTIKTTALTVIAVNLDTNAVVEYEQILPSTYKDEKAILKALDKVTPPEPNMKPVAIKNVHIQNTLYGMSQELFLANAEVLPSREKTDDNEN